MESVSLEKVIELKDNQAPRMLNWKENKHLIICGNDVNTTSYYYYWVSARGSVTLFAGSWYFEVTIKNKSPCRIGWCTDKYGNDDVLGCDEHSWCFDGSQQRKYHKSMEGTKYGEPWARGDIIGSHLDFEQRRISYYKNGKPLGVAFGSLRLANVAMFPIVGLSGDAKVTVNFGNLLHLPQGCFCMYPVLKVQDKKELEAAFNIYKSEDEDVISGEGLVRLATDLNSTGPMDPTLLMLAWILFSSRQWEFTKSEWLCSWALQGAYNMGKIKIEVEKWRSILKENEDVFRNFYQFVFEYLKQARTTNIDKHEAIIAWKIIGIDKRWEIFDKWEKYWNENTHKVVTKDTWNMLVRFIEKMGTDMKNYNEDDSWPLAIDEFVRVMNAST